MARLMNNTALDHDPSHSPDGSKIVFPAGNAAFSDVDIVIHEVSTGVVVDDVATNGDSMDWSNDGNSIYFHSLDLTAHPFLTCSLILLI